MYNAVEADDVQLCVCDREIQGSANWLVASIYFVGIL